MSPPHPTTLPYDNYGKKESTEPFHHVTIHQLWQQRESIEPLGKSIVHIHTNNPKGDPTMPALLLCVLYTTASPNPKKTIKRYHNLQIVDIPAAPALAHNLVPSLPIPQIPM